MKRPIKLIIQAEKEPLPENQVRASQTQYLRQEALNHPLVADVIEIFGGTVVDIKIEKERPLMMKNMGNMMKQAQQLQAKMVKLQEELSEKTIETSSGGGMIKVVANGKQQIVSIQIEKEVVDPEDVEMLQDLILAAVNDALAKSQEMVSGEMSKLTGGLNIPGLM